VRGAASNPQLAASFGAVHANRGNIFPNCRCQGCHTILSFQAISNRFAVPSRFGASVRALREPEQ
jgi:hypothetical protein